MKRKTQKDKPEPKKHTGPSPCCRQGFKWEDILLWLSKDQNSTPYGSTEILGRVKTCSCCCRPVGNPRPARGASKKLTDEAWSWLQGVNPTAPFYFEPHGDGLAPKGLAESPPGSPEYEALVEQWVPTSNKGDHSMSCAAVDKEFQAGQKKHWADGEEDDHE